MKSLIILLLLPFSFFSQKKINQEEFKDLIIKGNALIIDVRTPVEFSEGNINNAINIDYFSKSFPVTISKLDKQKNILVYCAAGGRSTSACLDFKELGFKKVYNLIGGYDDWKE
jgi:rhodanese-related sulfurtransferase